MALHLNKLEIVQGDLSSYLLNFVNVFLLFRYIFPLEKDGALPLIKLEMLCAKFVENGPVVLEKSLNFLLKNIRYFVIIFP